MNDRHEILDVLDDVPRTAKPREHGLTWMIDTGAGIHQLDDVLGVCAPHVDMVKLAFGTSLVTSHLDAKLAMIRSHGVRVCLGGTLFEVMYLRGRLDRYREFLRELDVDTVEISNGAVDIDQGEKVELIDSFAEEFRVVSEVGSKDSTVVVAPARWVRAIEAELEAGSSYVILEGRESGTAGLYRTSGEMRTGLVEEVLDAGIDPKRLVFEAPRPGHQRYLIELLGPDVNLGNIGLGDVIACECLRRGLRGDTVELFHGSPSPR